MEIGKKKIGQPSEKKIPIGGSFVLFFFSACLRTIFFFDLHHAPHQMINGRPLSREHGTGEAKGSCLGTKFIVRYHFSLVHFIFPINVPAVYGNFCNTAH